MATIREKVRQLIDQIDDARAAGSVTNRMLASVLNYFFGDKDVFEELDNKANKKDVYTKTETDTKLAAIVQTAETNINSLAQQSQAEVGYYECSTDADVAAKTIAATGYSLRAGGNIRIKMTNANTADAVTLNINNTGAKALFYNGEQASASNSWESGETVEIYYDGSKYNANNVAGGSGDGAFDVSAKYPTSGVDGGNTYTLDRALAVLNTNLSAKKKKGGMSIKFVQTSDNNYVQFLCIADEFTADTTKWRGVDKKPVSGSKNLIESNAVYKLEKTTAGLIDAESDADFLVADENGKVLAAFAKGGFKTKNFDSSKVSIQTHSVDAEYGDFNLADDKLNSILRLYNGHIRTKKFDSKSICDIINNNITYLSTVISKYDNKVAHCGTLEFDDFGNWYSAYYKDDETTHETPTNLTTKAMIAYGNLADQSKVTRIEVIGANQTVGNYTQGARAPYDPNFKIFNGIGRFYFNGYVNSKVVIAYRNFDISTKELDNNVYIAKLKYTVSRTEKTVDFTTTNLYTMLSELGISATFYNDLVLSSRFVQYESYWYVSLSGAFSQNLKPVILRTQDGITFEYVAYCSSFSGGSVESSLEIINNYIIVSQRGTTKCEIGKFDFNGNTIISPKTISNNLSKTALIQYNNKLICAFNVYPNITTEWGVVFRSHLRLAIIDTATLTINNYTDITNDAGIHYPFLNKYKGSLYMVFTEDRKKLNINETRSNISLTKLIN